MNRFRFAVRWLSAAYYIAVVLFAGCSNSDMEYQRVDFRRKPEGERLTARRLDEPLLQVAVSAMISPKETLIFYRELIDYIGSQVNRRTILIQRKTYGEVTELLKKQQIDMAFICSGPYVQGSEKESFTAIATPVIRGSPLYRSYLIVHQASPFSSLEDLKGRSFAFTDPDSNSGYLVPRYWLHVMNSTPQAFFRSTTFTYSHDNSIFAVAKNLVDAAAVDGLYWEYYQARNPYYSAQTRVIRTSDAFGSPPIVVSNALPHDIAIRLTETLLKMHEDPKGREILAGLLIDRFVEPKAEWYRPIRTMLDMVSQTRSDDVHGAS